ncbi:MAG: deoxyribodipyrimidine photo-lyase, partial [Porticoccaceae bacterium]
NKQTATYDPNGEFINHWQGNSHFATLDSMDAADWPI